jgi:hypothetical protein
VISFSIGGWHRPGFFCCWVVLVGQEGLLYAGLFRACSRCECTGHPRVVPVLGVEGVVVSLEGVGAWQIVALILQSSRVRVVWWVVSIQLQIGEEENQSEALSSMRFRLTKD